MKKHVIAALFLVLASLAAATPARATILAACAEDINCTFVGTVGITTNPSFFDETFSRLGLVLPSRSGGSNNYPPTNTIQLSPFSAASFWLSGYFYYQTNGNSAAGYNSIYLESADQVVRLALQPQDNAQHIRLVKRSAAGTVTTLVSVCPGTLPSSPGQGRIDLKIAYAVAGEIDVYVNGTLACSYSGDITTDGMSALAYAGFGVLGQAATIWSQLFISTEDTRSLHLLTCAPAAAGNTQAWTGSAGNINADSYLDSTFNFTATTNLLSQWTFGCTVPGNMGIDDVRESARVARGSTGPQHFRYSLHDGAADYDNGADIAPVVSFQNYEYDWGATSPATGSPWTATEIQALQSGLKSTP